jgi:hypothetical protein
LCECAGATVGPPDKPYVAEFLAVWKLLAEKQRITLGAPISADSQGPRLIHFQQFREQNDSIINSMEMHDDGCIYVAYTPLRGPVWYSANRYPPRFVEPNEADEPADPFTGISPKDTPIPSGPSGERRFSDLKRENVDPANWGVPSEAFRNGRGPAPRWFKICVPRVAPNTWTENEKKQIPNETLSLLFLDAGAYCFWNAYKPEGVPHIISARIAGLPDWQTVLPKNDYLIGGESQQFENGQKKYFPDLPVFATGPDGTTNFYVTWKNLMDLAQTDPNKVIDILKWRGHPNTDDLDRRIPWVSSSIEGVVTNSFLSGEDYSGDHSKPPGEEVPRGSGNIIPDYWMGTLPPGQTFGCGGVARWEFDSKNALCNDWIIYVKPEPEYRFMLASSPRASSLANCCNGREMGAGNDVDELNGNLENEIEQWLIPGGFRPEPGDRIYMTGRWIVDCGHDNWQSEIHPYELIVSSHTQSGRPEAIGNIEVEANVVVTGDWAALEPRYLDFDIWPPPRPSATAQLHFSLDPLDPTPTATHPRGTGIIQDLFLVEQRLQPADNPNHLHIQLRPTALTDPLQTGSLGDVYPNVRRRMAAKYHLWWE